MRSLILLALLAAPALAQTPPPGGGGNPPPQWALDRYADMNGNGLTLFAFVALTVDDMTENGATQAQIDWWVTSSDLAMYGGDLPNGVRFFGYTEGLAEMSAALDPWSDAGFQTGDAKCIGAHGLLHVFFNAVKNALPGEYLDFPELPGMGPNGLHSHYIGAVASYRLGELTAISMHWPPMPAKQ